MANASESSQSSDELTKLKRNRLQEWKTCCCRPSWILVTFAVVLMLIAAIIAIIVTSVADHFEREMEGSNDDVQPYSANLNELPAALQDQVRSQAGYQQGFSNPGVNRVQYNPNRQLQPIPNGYPPVYNGVPNNGLQQQGFNGQISPVQSQPPQGFNPNQQFSSNNQFNGRRRR